MIVNDFENKKTIDTETGAFLTNVDWHGYSEIATFKYVDGETEITFETHYSIVRDRPNETTVTYTLDNGAFFLGPPKRKGYVSKIEQTMQVYNLAYGGFNKPPQSVTCKVILAASFIAAVEKWENQNG